jgi:hypothetical protein
MIGAIPSPLAGEGSGMPDHLLPQGEKGGFVDENLMFRLKR